MKTKNILFGSTLLAAASLTFLATPTNAATLTWAGTDDHNSWNYTDTNWSNGSTFVSGDNVTFDNTATEKDVSIEDSITAGSITVSAKGYTFTIGNELSLTATTLTINSGTSLEITGEGTFTTSSTEDYSTIDGSLTIGSVGGTDSVTTTFGGYVYVGRSSTTGELTISGGSTTFSSYVYLGNSRGSSGTLTITGGTTKFENSVNVGNVGTGKLTISGGSTTFSSYVYLGSNSGSSGSMEITGGTTTFGSNVYVGYIGTGTLTITGGETTFSDVYLGYFSTSSGTMEISGGTTTFGSTVYVGFSSTDTIKISGGETTFSGSVYLGYGSGSSGELTISGGETSFGGTVYVGTSGTGSLSLTGGTITLSNAISNSGTVTVTDSVLFVLDNLTPSDNTYTLISGEGTIENWSTLTGSNFSISGAGRLAVEITTAGQVTITATGVVADLVWNGTADSNVWTNDGDKIWTNSDTDDADMFYDKDNVTFGSEGTKSVSISGTIEAGTITVTGNGYTFTFSDDSSVTATTLTINSGASLEITGTGTFTTSSSPTIEGSLTISDSVTTTFGGYVYVGRSSTTGELTITGGETTFSDRVYLGYNSGSSGSLTITGGKTTFESGTVYIGYNGTGSLTITGGETTFSGVYLGYFSTSSGTMEITGGTTTFGSNVYVGNAGKGELTISGGETTFGSTVDVGEYGTGTIEITGGTTTFSSNVYLGYSYGSSGTMEISGGTTTFKGDMTVGNNGKGALTITDGETTFKGSVSVNSSSSLSLTGGTITLSEAISNSGTVTVSNSVVFVLNDALITGTATGDTTTYTIISDGGTIENWDTLSASNFSLNGKGLGRSTVDVTTTAGQVTITYVAAENLVWNGTGTDNVWTNDGDKIWLNGTDSDYFYSYDNVTFNGDAAEKNVTISGKIEAGTITVTGSDYKFSFNADSSLTADSLTLSKGENSETGASATFSGGETTIYGNVRVDSSSSLSVEDGGTLTAESVYVNGINGALTLDGGTLNAGYLEIYRDVSANFSSGNLNIGSLRIIDSSRNRVTFGDGLTVGAYDENGLTLNEELRIKLDGSVGFDTSNGDIEIEGTLSDVTDEDGEKISSGSLTKTGSGTLTLDGENDYTGGTTISSGTVVAQRETALGTGTVAIAEDATLELSASGTFSNATSGNGTLSIASGATVSFTKSVGVQTVNVAYGATLSGSTTLTHSNAQLVLAGELALDASAGEQVSFTNGGTVILEDSATLNLSGISPTGIKPLSDSSTLGAGSNITIFSGATVEGDLSVENFLATDSTLLELSNDYAVVYDTSKGLSVMILESGDLSAITHGVRLHDGIGSSFISAIISDDDLDFDTGFKSTDDLSNPIVRALATGNVSSASQMLDTLAPNDYAAMVAMPTTSFHNDVNAIDNHLAAVRKTEFDENNRWGFFAQAQGTLVDNDDAKDTQTFDFQLYGVLAGADYRLDDGLTIGLTVGYDYGKADIHDNGGKIESDDVRITLFAGQQIGEMFFVNAGAQVGYGHYEAKRKTAYGNANGDTDGWNAGLFADVGMMLTLSEELKIAARPYVGLAYLHSEVGSFDDNIFDVDDFHGDSLRASIGCGLFWGFDLAEAAWTVGLDASYSHDFCGDEVDIDATCMSTDKDFGITAKALSKDIFSVGPVVSVGLTKSIDIFAGYAFQAGTDSSTGHNVYLGLRTNF